MVGLVALASLVGACKKRGVSDDMPVCLVEVAGAAAEESAAQELPPDLWFSILLTRFDREQMLPPEQPTDCAGGNVLTPTLPPLAEGEKPAEEGQRVVAGCEIGKDPEAGRLPARPLTAEDLVLGEGPNGTVLAWAQASHYDDGTASGPVALVQWTKKGVAVRGLGTLRAHKTKARLRLEESAGTQILIVESDRCAEDGKVCQRIMKLLPLLDQRFVTVPLKLEPNKDTGEAGGTCLGEAEFVLFDQYTSILPDGWERKFEIVRSVTFDEGVPLVSEQVVIRDKDPAQPDAPPQEFRDAAVDRRLVYKDRFFETRESLWEHMIANYGSVAHDAKPAEAE